MPKYLMFFGLIAVTILGLFLCKWTTFLPFNAQQILSIGIFSMFIYGTLLYGEFRLAFAFGGIALLMICNLLTVHQFILSASLDVIIFLIGTFLVIGFLEETRFFEHIVTQIVRAVGPRPQMLLLILMTIASIASALVGEVTAVLFMAGAMLHLTSKYKLKPTPFIIMLVFACNNGSAMSSIGNPIGVLIALKTGLSFMDFVKYAAPVALVVDVAVYFICRWWFAEAFNAFGAAVKAEFERTQKLAARIRAKTLAMAGGAGAAAPLTEEEEEFADIGSEGTLSDSYYDAQQPDTMGDWPSRKLYLVSWGVLLALIALLVTHKQTEALFHLHEGTMMVAAALVMGSVVLFIRRDAARELVERRIDWWTLSFFMMLFASVGTLEDTKVTDVIAHRLGGLGTNQMMIIQVIGWATGWLSAFLDNVLAVATFMPVVHDVRVNAGVPYSSSIYWFMLFGGTFMGNMTIIGSTANIVAVGLLEKRGHGTVSFGYWMKIGFIVAIVSMLIATAMLALMHPFIPSLPVPTEGP